MRDTLECHWEDGVGGIYQIDRSLDLRWSMSVVRDGFYNFCNLS